MSLNFKEILEIKQIEASAPCRIDMGGTLDISTFYYPLRYLAPCTFNIAVDLRTRVRLMPYEECRVKISSRGFESAEYPYDEMPFDHPLGLMFAVAAYFGIHGVHIYIDSESPPRSALGGSSVAAVALIGAFSRLTTETGKQEPMTQEKIAMIAHAIEQSVAGIPCGLQDQLAAVYGGVNTWYWQTEYPAFIQKPMFDSETVHNFESHLLLAYAGVPHESKNINGQWVQGFLSGKQRKIWTEILVMTHEFVSALASENYTDACRAMNREVALRMGLTPDVVDEIGKQLIAAALNKKCGARFTGAGGGGCIWALGKTDNIAALRPLWQHILSQRKDARLLDMKIASHGILIDI